MSDLLEAFESDELTVGIMGLGYVGLPLAVEVARAGLTALGFDVNESVVASINDGKSHVKDLCDAEVAEQVEAGVLSATTDMGQLSQCDVISICVPTPLNKTHDPDISFILSAGGAIRDALRPGQLVVLESTTYPGTTSEVLLPTLQESGLEVGTDFFLCFSPERVDPGNETWKTKNTPKVIGGTTAACLEAATKVYRRFIDTLVPVSSPEAAEMVKILENTFRAVNIALVNETAMIADRLGVNIWEVVDAADTKPFGFMKFTPGPGLGGHCIPVDPHYLSWKMRTMNYRTRFIELASEINSEMPLFVVGKVREALNEHRKSVKGSSVLVLGVAYKPDIDDVRESPAIDIITLLERDGARVDYSDPHVPELHDETSTESWIGVPLTKERVASVDAVVIVTDHGSVDYDMVIEEAGIVVDARNVMTDHVTRDADGRAPAWIVKV